MKREVKYYKSESAEITLIIEDDWVTNINIEVVDSDGLGSGSDIDEAIFNLLGAIKKSSREWRLIKKRFPEGIRYLLQEKHTDATKPYFLTKVIFQGRRKALDMLKRKRDESRGQTSQEREET